MKKLFKNKKFLVAAGAVVATVVAAVVVASKASNPMPEIEA